MQLPNQIEAISIARAANAAHYEYLATKQTCIRLIYGNALVALRIVFVVKRCHRRSGFCTDIIINLEWTHFRIKLQHRLVVILPNLSFLLVLDCN